MTTIYPVLRGMTSSTLACKELQPKMEMNVKDAFDEEVNAYYMSEPGEVRMQSAALESLIPHADSTQQQSGSNEVAKPSSSSNESVEYAAPPLDETEGQNGAAKHSELQADASQQESDVDEDVSRSISSKNDSVEYVTDPVNITEVQGTATEPLEVQPDEAHQDSDEGKEAANRSSSFDDFVEYVTEPVNDTEVQGAATESLDSEDTQQEVEDMVIVGIDDMPTDIPQPQSLAASASGPAAAQLFKVDRAENASGLSGPAVDALSDVLSTLKVDVSVQADAIADGSASGSHAHSSGGEQGNKEDSERLGTDRDYRQHRDLCVGRPKNEILSFLKAFREPERGKSVRKFECLKDRFEAILATQKGEDITYEDLCPLLCILKRHFGLEGGHLDFLNKKGCLRSVLVMLWWIVVEPKRVALCQHLKAEPGLFDEAIRQFEEEEKGAGDDSDDDDDEDEEMDDEDSEADDHTFHGDSETSHEDDDLTIGTRGAIESHLNAAVRHMGFGVGVRQFDRRARRAWTKHRRRRRTCTCS